MSLENKAFEKMFSWIVDHKVHFSHKHGKNEEECIKLVKPLGELALCCDILIKNGQKRNESMSLLAWAWKEIDEGNYLRNLLLARPDLLMISSLYYSFSSNGFINYSLMKIISKQARTLHATAIQYPYWRRLDLELALAKLGVVTKFEPDLKNTWSYHQPEPWMMDDDSAYALTHEVFYLTDFGTRPHIINEDTRRYIARWSNVWREIYLEHNNLDVFAELLMVSSCIKDEKSYEDHYSVISEQVSNMGYLPGPNDGAKNLMVGVTDSARCTFLKNYHTTLVGIMALSLRQSHLSKS